MFITQFCFAAPKKYQTKFIHDLIIKIPNKQELQQIAFNHSSDIGYEDFMNFTKKDSKTIFFVS